MHGRVAEYVLLSIHKWEPEGGNAIYNVMSCLDNLLLGDYTNMDSNAIHKLNACKRRGRTTDGYVLDYQLLLENVMSLGNTMDGEYAGTMLLENAGITAMERQLILATNARSFDFFKVANALRQLIGLKQAPGKEAAMVSEEPLGWGTQERFMSNDNRTRRKVPKQGVQRQ